MWDLPRPGLKSVFPVLAGGLSTTAAPGKPGEEVFNKGKTDQKTQSEDEMKGWEI